MMPPALLDRLKKIFPPDRFSVGESEHGPSLELMKKIKDLLDPHHLLNQGKISHFR